MEDELMIEARKIAKDYLEVDQKLRVFNLQYKLRIGVTRATKIYNQLDIEGLV